MNLKEAFAVLQTKNWSAQCNPSGNLWAVGPETSEGTINVLGMAPTFPEAVEMAQRSEVKK